MIKNEKALVSLRDVGVCYKQARSVFGSGYFDALTSVSIDLFPGDSLGVLGNNGVGKSTLLRVLAGIIKPDKGEVLIDDNTSVALLALQAGFDVQLNGVANAILSGMLLGYSRKEVEDKLSDIIAFSELGGAINKPVKTYSAGMRARLGFSVAYYMNPDVLLIDEVLGVGDAVFRKKATRAMEEKIQSEQTVVLVSHQTGLIKQLCNRAVWLEDGCTKMEGDSKTVGDAYEAAVVS
jgi:lipopolysaccharide transport system ATP-binding protein